MTKRISVLFDTHVNVPERLFFKKSADNNKIMKHYPAFKLYRCLNI